jgi:hypothetical protein
VKEEKKNPVGAISSKKKAFKNRRNRGDKCIKLHNPNCVYRPQMMLKELITKCFCRPNRYTANQNKGSNTSFRRWISKAKRSPPTSDKFSHHLPFTSYHDKPLPKSNGAPSESLKVRADHKLIAKCSILPTIHLSTINPNKINIESLLIFINKKKPFIF